MAFELDIDPDDFESQALAVEAIDPTAKDSRGGPIESWSPVASGIPCLIVPRRATAEERAAQRSNVRYSTVLFFRPLPVVLTAAHRLRYDDPATTPPTARYLVPGPVRNAAELGVAWAADCQEVTG